MNSGTFRKGEKRPNQGKHGPPKATLDARRAIAAFVDDNAHRLTEWLDQVAQGVVDHSDESKMLVKPDPAKAFDMFQSVIEYHIPKLARTEHVGDGGGPVRIIATSDDQAI
jgi:hypothetical protein